MGDHPWKTPFLMGAIHACHHPFPRRLRVSGRRVPFRGSARFFAVLRPRLSYFADNWTVLLTCEETLHSRRVMDYSVRRRLPALRHGFCRGRLSVYFPASGASRSEEHT